MNIFDRDAARRRLVQAGLERHADRLIALVEPSVRLESLAVDAGDLPVGASRLGGAPDLPAGVAWPSFRDEPLAFVAQLRLGDVRGLPGCEALPAGGLLSFFYDARQSVWGFDPADRDGWRVIHSPADVALERRLLPAALPAEGRYRERALRARLEQTWAPWESFDVAALGLTSDETFAYSGTFPDEDEAPPVHRLLGHPDPIQGDMQSECQLAAHGVYCGDASQLDSPRAAALLPDSAAWRLLLQIDSDDGADMMWGDVGRIYFWMRRDDLAAGRFARAWCVLQCS